MNDATDAGAPTPGDGRAVVEHYFRQLQTAARDRGTTIDRDAIDDLRAYVSDRLANTGGSAADATSVLGELGTPETLAEGYASSVINDDYERMDGSEPTGALAGRVFGIPYDLRLPTSTRFARRYWNPSNRKILVPKALGIGWTINLGAIAVRAHLIGEDDEDEPFDSLPQRIVLATLALPLAVVIVMGVIVASAWSGLPASIPTHWGAAGTPDGYSERTTSIVMISALAVVPLLAAAWVHLARRRSFNRVAASGIALWLAGVALTILVQSIFTLDGGVGVWPTWVGIVAALLLPLILFTLVSRMGRAAEQRNDLSPDSGKGPAL